jgi:hypothetical protein
MGITGVMSRHVWTPSEARLKGGAVRFLKNFENFKKPLDNQPNRI